MQEERYHMPTPESTATLKQIIDSAEQILSRQNLQVSALELVMNLTLAAVLSFILGKVYIRFGHSLSNRRLFAKNFMMITMTTMLVITIVKSSLALSLGLVGALSIVRFRAAIKEPEELSYLFLAIGIGLGLGANQGKISVIAFLFIILVIIMKGYKTRAHDDQNLYLTVTSRMPMNMTLKIITQTLSDFCSGISLKRFDERKDILEASFIIECDNFDAIDQCKNKLRELDSNIEVTFLDNQGIL